MVLNLVVCGACLRTPAMAAFKAEAAHRGAVHKSSIASQVSSSDHCIFQSHPPPLQVAVHRLAYWLLLVNAVCHQIGFVIYFTFVFPHLTSLGVPDFSAAWVMTTYGLASIATRLATSLLDNRPWLRRWAVFAAAASLEGVFFLALTFLPGRQLWAYLTLSACSGLCGGFLGSLVCLVALDVLGPAQLHRAFTHIMVPLPSLCDSGLSSSSHCCPGSERSGSAGGSADGGFAS